MPVWKYSVFEGGSPGTENIFGGITTLPDLTITPTSMRYSGAFSPVALFQGTGITTDISDHVTGGTITKLTVKGMGALVLTATGLNISAESLFNTLAPGNAFNLAQLAFSGRDTIFGTSFGEDLYGFGSKDALYGGAGSDTLSGGNGNDSLYGGSGNDSLRGDGGDNLLSGGAGKDTLLANDGGTDRFVFNTALGSSNVDVIVDFNALNDDRILLDNDIFKALGTQGALAPAKFHAGTAAADASDRIIYDSATGKLFYDKDGTGAAGQRLIATLGGDSAGPILHASDFLIIN